MGRGRRATYKKTRRGRRPKDNDDDDEGDEEYVAEEEDDEEEEGSASTCGSDAPFDEEASYEFSDEDEDEEVEIPKYRASGGAKGRRRSTVSEEDDEEFKAPRRNRKKSRGLGVAKKGRPRSRKRRARGSDSDVEEEEEDDDEFEVSWKPRVSGIWKGRPRSRKRGAKVLDNEVEYDEQKIEVPPGRYRVSDDEMEGVSVVKKGRARSRKRGAKDSDNEVEYDEEKIEVPRVRSNPGRYMVSDDEVEDVSVAKKGRTGPRKQEARDSDYEVGDDDEEDEEFFPDDDESDGEEVLPVYSRRGAKNHNVRRHKRNTEEVLASKRRRKSSTSSDDDFNIEEASASKRRRKSSTSSDDDFVVKGRVSVGVAKTTAQEAKSRSKKRSVGSDSLDSDFVPTDDDFVLDDQVMVSGRKCSEMVKKTTGSRGRRKKRPKLISESSDSDYVISEDDELIADDQVSVDKRRKKNKMEQRLPPKTRRKSTSTSLNSSNFEYKSSENDEFTDEEISLNKQPTEDRLKEVDSDTSDSDYSISEDDDFMIDNNKAVEVMQKKGLKKKTERTTRRRRSSAVSDSSDYNEDVNFEEEVRYLKLEEKKPGRLVAVRSKEEKGKEKENIELAKQVCGICLSEEQNGVVQGLLNCCSHYFCFACIMEWSKVESRCPVCKRRFEEITKSGRSDPGFGMRKAVVIRVEKRDQVYHPSEEELRGMLDPYENVVCIVCQEGGDDSLMLLCDLCDSSAHTYCVGHGMEVPEGNWYCSVCKSASDAQMLSQTQISGINRESGNNDSSVDVNERLTFANMHLPATSPRPASLHGQSSSLRIDLNASPRDFSGEEHYTSSPLFGTGVSPLSGRRVTSGEEHYASSSPVFGTGVSTVSGRRVIQQRIRFLLSSSRPGQNFGRTTNMHSSVTDAIDEERECNQGTLLASQCVPETRQTCGPSSSSCHSALAPCMQKEGSSFRHVQGAKEHVHSLVRNYLRKYSRDFPIERNTFKSVGRKSTHTILAACGIEHKRDMVPIDIDPPNECAHDYSAYKPSELVKGCCSSCFTSFVEGVVLRLINIP